MKSFKYTINGNEYKVHINSIVDDIAEVEVNGTPYSVKMENNINADRDGKIVEIKVNKGDSVLEGADLVVIG